MLLRLLRTPRLANRLSNQIAVYTSRRAIMSVEDVGLGLKRPLSPGVGGGCNENVKAIEKNGTKDVSGSPAPKKPRNSNKKKRKYNNKEQEPTSPFGVLKFEIEEIIAENGLGLEQIANPMTAILNDVEIKAIYNRVVSGVKLLRYASNGDCIALIPSPEKAVNPEQTHQIVLVPFGIPGETCKINIHKSHPSYCESDLLEIEKESPLRDNSLIKCKYFGACSGCQYQAVSYDQQLEFKRQTVINAYRFFARQLHEQKRLPEIGQTVGSPLEYGYRTKLTPHFDMPRAGLKPGATRPNLGFGMKGRPTWRKIPDMNPGAIMDIEECVIGTPIINVGMRNERRNFENNYTKYKKGATFLLRENTRTENDPLEDGSVDPSGEISILKEENVTYGEVLKTCVTNNGQIVKEVVEGYQFEFVANEFFQNNNSILTKILGHVRESLQLDHKSENYLIDAYCGSGLFSVTSASSVERVVGVEISEESVRFAKRNAELNGVENASFIQGKAEKIFQGIDLPHDKTSIILDPPRKGCDEIFLKQLADFNPKRVIYISCNVHSQARDLEYFLTQTENGAKFRVDSIKGFDFFPQTHHVEGVAVLSRK
ncbi:unnamed protein product [Kuraishia capsulata CBS 1993]|uniref:TRAM domain-containing protein n=1 Tax=Kuraishia capsulata CBS 1993 TaxID=1382522 RepID=W6MXS2_9ASCO|nr:uncharacterized protein KUCA_T00005373001 [Kuraishia capsulata CBS 1993]CDK29385.1 unnamed protein product [Kuraishia capsulata CBS 1993]